MGEGDGQEQDAGQGYGRKAVEGGQEAWGAGGG
jgi:hypothetical protein